MSEDFCNCNPGVGDVHAVFCPAGRIRALEARVKKLAEDRNAWYSDSVAHQDRAEKAEAELADERVLVAYLDGRIRSAQRRLDLVPTISDKEAYMEALQALKDGLLMIQHKRACGILAKAAAKSAARLVPGGRFCRKGPTHEGECVFDRDPDDERECAG